MTAVVLDPSGQPIANKPAVVTWKDGKETLQTDTDGKIHWKVLKNRIKGLTLKLPEGTRALLRLTDPAGNSVGPLFTPENDPSKEKVKSAGGTIVLEVPDKLATSDKADTAKKGAFVKTHEYKMTAGETYTIDLESDEFDAFLRLEDSEGAKLKEDDDGAGFLNSRIVFTPKEDGVYRLAVTSADPGGVGRIGHRSDGSVDEKKSADDKK